MHLLSSPECYAFSVAALILAGLIATEIIALILGFSLSQVVDKPDMDGDLAGGGILSWINIGHLPVLILLMLGLGVFAMAGFTLQLIANSVWGFLPGFIAVPVAIVLSIPVIRSSSRFVARLVPRDETYAVETSDFIGMTAEVTTGPLDQSLPGRVRLKDVHGNWHTVRATAAPGQAPLPVSCKVLLVDCANDIFTAVSAPQDLVENENTSPPKVYP